jgi:hypothetical protein
VIEASLVAVIVVVSASVGAAITRARMMRQRRPCVFFVDGNGNVFTLTDRRRQPIGR